MPSLEPDSFRVRQLWRAVIAQAITDHFVPTTSTDGERIRWQAERWITERGADFLFVCDMADLRPEDVRKGRDHCVDKGEAIRWRDLPSKLRRGGKKGRKWNRKPSEQPA